MKGSIVNRRHVTALFAAALTLSACSSVAAGQQAVEVDSWGDPTVSGCAAEETQVSTMSVDLYRYPARQISWDANNDPGAERGPYVVLSNSKDQAYMNVPLTVTFDLTTDCDKLKDFHRNYGTKYQAWLDDNGNTTSKWVELLQYVIGQPTEQTLLAVSQKYTYQQLWNDEAVRQEYKNALQIELPKQSAARTGGVEYFTNFQVTVGKPEPADERLRNARAAEQAAIAEASAAQTKATSDANARKAAAEAELAAAQAEVATKQAEANKRLAEIAGFGTGPDAVEAWLKAQCIEKAPDCTPWPQPIIAGAR
jgi:SPFH domain / Band 7 family